MAETKNYQPRPHGSEGESAWQHCPVVNHEPAAKPLRSDRQELQSDGHWIVWEKTAVFDYQWEDRDLMRRFIQSHRCVGPFEGNAYGEEQEEENPLNEHHQDSKE